MSDAALIEARGLCRRYGRRSAVRDLDLSLERGDVLGLLGPNGAGKTTTLRMLAGILAPSAGRIRVKGIDIAEQPQLARSHVGYLPETPPLHRELTPREFLNFCARLHAVTDAKAATERALAACNLTDVADRLIGSLSKGYQQRVGLAQAIVHRPSVIVLDEPTIGLDPRQIRDIRALIADLSRDHAIILSTHILGEVQAMCSRVTIMSAGQAVFEDTVDELRAVDGQHILITGLRRPPAPRELLKLPGVSHVEPLAGFRFRLHCAEGSDPRDALAGAAAAGDWGLFELREERRTLEDLFVELTAAEPQT